MREKVNNNEYQTLILAALLHDIGKFMQRAEVECRHEKNEKEMQLWCPKWNGIPTHKHVLWTRSFFDDYSHYLPTLSTSDDAIDNIANLATKHHSPETSLQWIIAEADRLSFGMDRLPKDEEDEATGKDAYKKIRLRPIFEEIKLSEREEESKHRYELNPLSLEKDILFPKPKEELNPKEGELLVPLYHTLWEGFIGEFAKLPNHTTQAFIISLLYLLEKYTWGIPSSTIDLPDISLFDHCKTTAAIASCLYQFHTKNKTLSEQAIKDKNADKYLLVCGDLSGIQKFIYKISSKGAARLLKGRSFYLQLLSETIAHHFLQETGYTLSNLLYSGGGRFYLLLDFDCKNAIKEANKKINKEILTKFNGEIYSAIGWSELSGNDLDLLKGKISQKWREAGEVSNQKKRQKFSKFSYDEIFKPFGKGGKEDTCDVCKNEGELSEKEEIKRCSTCIRMEEIGSALKNAKFILETYGNTNDKKDISFEFAETNYSLLHKVESDKIRDKGGILWAINDPEGFLEQGAKNIACGFKFIGGNFAPMNGEEICTFDKLAEKSSGGLKRLGVLRMDVDNLGSIFTHGLKEKASITRMTELSRKLAIFFGGYLNKIAEKYKNDVYIIYSGGDDLFIVGAWDKIPIIAKKIREEFANFTQNPDFTISGGIALIPQKYPIYKGADLSGEAEDKAKGYKRKDNQKEKDAVLFLGSVVGWDEFEVASEIKEMMRRCIKEGKPDETSKIKCLNKGIINRLRQIYLLYLENKRRWEDKKKGITMEEIKEKVQYNQWLWRTVYSLNRYANENKSFEKEVLELMEAIKGKKFRDKFSNREIIDFLSLPTRWAEFLLREEVKR